MSKYLTQLSTAQSKLDWAESYNMWVDVISAVKPSADASKAEKKYYKLILGLNEELMMGFMFGNSLGELRRDSKYLAQLYTQWAVYRKRSSIKRKLNIVCNIPAKKHRV
jgi:hypothetical protein